MVKMADGLLINSILTGLIHWHLSYGCARVNDLLLSGAAYVEVVWPYRRLVALLMPPPLAFGIVTDQAEAELPVSWNILAMFVALEVFQEERSRVNELTR